jgi:ribosomal protein S18 acetylase RimI-like enzyme
MTRIRIATSGDVNEIQHVLHTTWKDTYGSYLTDETLEEVYKNWQSIEFLNKQITNPDVYFPIAVIDDTIIGLATARMNNDIAMLFRVYVLPEYQRHGVGSELLEGVINHFASAKKIRLSVEKTNDRAKTFYERHGFTVVGEEQERVGNETIDGYVMEKTLLPL